MEKITFYKNVGFLQTYIIDQIGLLLEGNGGGCVPHVHGYPLLRVWSVPASVQAPLCIVSFLSRTVLLASHNSPFSARLNGFSISADRRKRHHNFTTLSPPAEGAPYT